MFNIYNSYHKFSLFFYMLNINTISNVLQACFIKNMNIFLITL